MVIYIGFIYDICWYIYDGCMYVGSNNDV